MSEKKRLKNYRRHGQNAVSFFHSGQYRRSADEYLLAFLAGPDKTDVNRWQIFHGYTSNLVEKYFEPSDDDFEALVKVKEDKDELKLYRVQAGFTAALLNFDRGQRFEAADSYRDAIRIGEKKKSDDDERTVCVMKATANSGFEKCRQTQKEIMADILRECRSNLNVLTSRANCHNIKNEKFRSDGTLYPSTEKLFKFSNGPGATIVNSTNYLKLTKIGGDVCDCCKKVKTSDKPLSQCSRCKKAYYCSRDCQLKQWTLHKRYCRKRGEIKFDDLMLLNGLQSKPELNNTIVRVVGPVNQHLGRYEVELDGGSTSISVAMEKLEHVRPRDCLT